MVDAPVTHLLTARIMRIEAMTSTSRVARTSGLAGSVTSNPVMQPPTKTNR